MKHMMLVVALAASCQLWADTETVDGYTWTFQAVGEDAELCGRDILGSARCAVFPRPSGFVSVPERLGGRRVTGIDRLSFLNCGDLMRVALPSTLKRIGVNAFRNCSRLTEISLPNGVVDIGDWAFGDCAGLNALTMPPGVTNIGEGAFHRCAGLVDVTIPKCVTSIRWNCFSGCTNLTQVTIPGNVAMIGEEAFYGCGSLTNVVISQGVKRIGRMAFRGCGKLTDIVIPASIQYIGEYAFLDCGQIRRVVLLGRNTYIGMGAFDPHVEMSIPRSSRVRFEFATVCGTVITLAIAILFAIWRNQKKMVDKGVEKLAEANRMKNACKSGSRT